MIRSVSAIVLLSTHSLVWASGIIGTSNVKECKHTEAGVKCNVKALVNVTINGRDDKEFVVNSVSLDAASVSKVEDFLGNKKLEGNLQVYNPVTIKISKSEVIHRYHLSHSKTAAAYPREESFGMDETCDRQGADDYYPCGYAKLNSDGSHQGGSGGFCCDCDKTVSWTKFPLFLSKDRHNVLPRGASRGPCGDSGVRSTGHCMTLGDSFWDLFEIKGPKAEYKISVTATQHIPRKQPKEFSFTAVDMTNDNDAQTKTETLVLQNVAQGKAFESGIVKGSVFVQGHFRTDIDNFNNVSSYFAARYNPKGHETLKYTENLPFEDHQIDKWNRIKKAMMKYKKELDPNVARIKQLVKPTNGWKSGLLIPKSQTGGECNKVGVNYQSFHYGIPCRQAPNTCLKNQIADMLQDVKRQNSIDKFCTGFEGTDVPEHFKPQFENDTVKCNLSKVDAHVTMITLELEINDLIMMTRHPQGEIFSVGTPGSNFETNNDIRGELHIRNLDKDFPATFETEIQCNDPGVMVVTNQHTSTKLLADKMEMISFAIRSTVENVNKYKCMAILSAGGLELDSKEFSFATKERVLKTNLFDQTYEDYKEPPPPPSSGFFEGIGGFFNGVFETVGNAFGGSSVSGSCDVLDLNCNLQNIGLTTPTIQMNIIKTTALLSGSLLVCYFIILVVLPIVFSLTSIFGTIRNLMMPKPSKKSKKHRRSRSPSSSSGEF